jgi:hypothetical protein
MELRHLLLNYLFVDVYRVGARRGAVGWGTALQAGRSRVLFPMVSLEICYSEAGNPSGRTMAPGVDSASNGNEYQEYFSLT